MTTGGIFYGIRAYILRHQGVHFAFCWFSAKANMAEITVQLVQIVACS